MRISDWSSDVCSSDLQHLRGAIESRGMTRRLAPGRLVIASHNAGKVREIGELLGPHGVETVSAAALGLPEPPETGTTFVATAELKARAAAAIDRESVQEGKRVSSRDDLGVRRQNNKQKEEETDVHRNN